MISIGVWELSEFTRAHGDGAWGYQLESIIPACVIVIMSMYKIIFLKSYIQ